MFTYTKRYGNIPTGTPLTGASNMGRVGKIAILDQYLASFRVVNVQPISVIHTAAPDRTRASW